MRLQILSVGITAPGVSCFQSLRELTKSEAEIDTTQPLEKYSPTFLPANERRRTTATIKLALKTAEEAIQHFQQMFPQQNSAIPTLFVSKDGDTLISSTMCKAVTESEPMISPIQFHNSVHNAPAGYWMIGQHNICSANAISAGIHSVGNALLEGYLVSEESGQPVLVVAYDLPINEAIPTDNNAASYKPFAFAMVVNADNKIEPNGLVCLQMQLTSQVDLNKTQSKNPFQGVPAADIFPMLEKIAASEFKNDEFTYSINAYQQLKVTGAKS